MKISSVFFLSVFAFVIGPKSDHCLIPESLKVLVVKLDLLDLSKLLHGFVKIDTWISLSVTWICQGCRMDLSKMLHGFIKVVTCICQSCSLYFLSFGKKKEAEV